ncbi:DUF2663 family protein [Geomicrobium sp. JCM 19038]|uniref:DUF2663 family protein n=1 Tax=Geomicrobium sp. JCM 19038 TaxID=1460635 RepID=UPI00045F2489|nr:DUF2663 family protein [Geomicrobium sp. JCM 19038]GAK06617.1 hypothetical protein JCM19038_320 [Geomicrobium sp. JCM 19038]
MINNGMISPTLAKLLRELIKRKKAEKKEERTVITLGWCAAACWLIALSYIIFGFGSEHTSIVNRTTESELGPLLIVMGLGATAMLTVYRKRYDEAEKDYKSLRNQVIDRYDEFWGDEELKGMRYDVYDWLEKEHGVNLFYR